MSWFGAQCDVCCTCYGMYTLPSNMVCSVYHIAYRVYSMSVARDYIVQQYVVDSIKYVQYIVYSIQYVVYSIPYIVYYIQYSISNRVPHSRGGVAPQTRASGSGHLADSIVSVSDSCLQYLHVFHYSTLLYSTLLYDAILYYSVV